LSHFDPLTLKSAFEFWNVSDCVFVRVYYFSQVPDNRMLIPFFSLAQGGTPARFLIIDDGWQSIAADNTLAGDATAVTQGTQ